MGGNGVDPGGEVLLDITLSHVLPHSDESVLHHVSRLLFITQQFQSQRKHHPLIRLHHTTKSFLLASLAPNYYVFCYLYHFDVLFAYYTIEKMKSQMEKQVFLLFNKKQERKHAPSSLFHP
jgi:hypothetical protein